MIAFVPERGHILICNFDMANVPPEMPKVRRIVVVSPRSYNGTRRCIVVPFSATRPRVPQPSHVPVDVGLYRSLSIPVWAICDALDHVSFDRLDRVKVGKTFLDERLKDWDMHRIEHGMRHALGLL